MLQIHPVGILALVAVAMCWALAMVLFRTGTPGSVARKLSLLLVVEGITLITTGFLDLFLTETARAQTWYPAWLAGEMNLHTLGDCAMLALYPPFLAAALQTPLTRPFGTRSVKITLYLVSAALFFAVFFTPLKLGATLLYFCLSLLFVFALIASVNAWLLAEGPARARAGSFALAFGIRDLCWGFVYGGAILMIWTGEYAVVDSDASSPIYVVYALGTLLAVPLIAYGILRTQLFDIDLKIRWTIKQSTLAGVFFAVMFLISEGASRFFEAELGGIAGLLAAGIVMFFLAPLQRFSERVASAAMPNTQNTPEYVIFRKLQVYEAAFAEAAEQGGVSQKERALLNALRDSLGISAADAEAIEKECLGLA